MVTNKLSKFVFLLLTSLAFISNASANTFKFSTSDIDNDVVSFSTVAPLTNVEAIYSNDTDVIRLSYVFEESSSGVIPEVMKISLNARADEAIASGGTVTFVLDATSANSPILNVFAGNGLDNSTATSFRDGSRAFGIQAPDRILTSLNPTDVRENDIRVEVNDGTTTAGVAYREFVIELDGTSLQEHVPLYPGNLSDGATWRGIAFSSELDACFNAIGRASTSYNAEGFLEDVRFNVSDGIGLFDIQNAKPWIITPICTAPAGFTVDIGETVKFQAASSSLGDGSLTFAVENAPTGSIYSPFFGRPELINFEFTPGVQFEGTTTTVDFVFTNFGIASRTCSTTITVNPNPAPVANVTSLGSLSCASDRTTISLDGSGSTDANAGPNADLGYVWQSDCPNAVFSSPFAAQTDITFDTMVNNRPTGCLVTLTVSDGQKTNQAQTALNISGCGQDCAGTINGTAEIDSCGVCNGQDADLDRCGICGGDGSSCLACTEVNQSQRIVELDGSLLQMQRDVFRLSRSIRKNNNGRLGNRLAQLLADSEALFQTGWVTINAVPSVSVQCGNQQFCVSQNFSGNTVEFLSSASEIRRISETFNRRLRRLHRVNNVDTATRRRQRRPFKRIRATDEQINQDITSLFVVSDTCQ